RRARGAHLELALGSRHAPEARGEGHELSAQGLAGAARARLRRAHHLFGSRRRRGASRRRPGRGPGRRRQPRRVADPLPQRVATGRRARRIPVWRGPQARHARLASAGWASTPGRPQAPARVLRRSEARAAGDVTQLRLDSPLRTLKLRAPSSSKRCQWVVIWSNILIHNKNTELYTAGHAPGAGKLVAVSPLSKRPCPPRPTSSSN